MPISKYSSIIKALNESNHVVVGMFTNLNPNHRVKAERIPKIFDELKAEFRVQKYDIIGHSIGAKIALLVAALYDEDGNVKNILALDPVDQTYPEFTNPSQLKNTLNKDDGSSSGARSNLSLDQSQANITITCTDSGYWIKKAHNGREIQRNNPKARLVMQRNTHHHVYCDDEGVLSWKALTSKGSSPDRNRAVKEETILLVKEIASKASVTGKTSVKVNSIVGRAKKAVKEAKNDLTEIGQDAQRQGKAIKGAATLKGVLG